jgi:hypothetical protein
MSTAGGGYNLDMRALVIAATLVFVSTVPGLSQEPSKQEETKKVPKDSVRVTVVGCLKGRVLAVTSRPDVDVSESGRDLTGRSFRLAGKKDVMSVVKREDGNTVRITGLLRKMDLEPSGMSFKGGRIVVGGARSNDPSRPSVPDPAANVVVMDIEGIQPLESGCAVRQ